ncbi:MAG: hypothetical protein F3745_06815 [Nitrospinae bacterium]|nr:hypothetical protein [Nitrospinota bacterium]
MKKTGLYFDQSNDSSVKVEIYNIHAGEKVMIFEKHHSRLEKGWMESLPDSFLAEDKKVFFRLTNTSPGPISIPVHRRPKYTEGFNLTLASESGDAEKIEGGLLRFYVQEDPLFLHDSDLPFSSIKQSLIQEKVFLIFWFILLTVCVVRTSQYGKHRRKES